MSKPRYFTVSVLACAVLSACASRPAKQQPTIEPITQIRHSAGAGSAVDQYERGAYHQKRGELDRALVAYGAALTFDYKHAEARNAMAAIYVQRGQIADAQAILQEAITQKPDAAYLRNNLGYLHYLEGDHPAAIRELRMALRLDPRNDWARNNLQMAQTEYAKASVKPAEPVQPAAPAAQAAAPFQIWGEVVTADTPPEPASIGAVSSETLIAQQAVPVTVSLGAEQLVQTPSSLGSAGQSLGNVAVFTETAVPTPTVLPPEPLGTGQSVQLNDGAFFSIKPYQLHVLNAAGVRGIARKASEFLREKGVVPQQIGDERPYRAVTRIEYREGYLLQAARLRASLPNQPVIVKADNFPGTADVKLVLGRDVAGKSSLFQASSSRKFAVRVAAAPKPVASPARKGS